MKETPRPMSTIEKAAARLAARQRSSARPPATAHAPERVREAPAERPRVVSPAASVRPAEPAGAAPAPSRLIQESTHLAEDAVLTSNVDRLSILPAGEPNERADGTATSG